MPQKIGHDVDLNTLPLVAFTEKVRTMCRFLPFPLLFFFLQTYENIE